ncbi:hypothetical protein D9M72_451660 [compost metagenome]
MDAAISRVMIESGPISRNGRAMMIATKTIAIHGVPKRLCSTFICGKAWPFSAIPHSMRGTAASTVLTVEQVAVSAITVAMITAPLPNTANT